MVKASKSLTRALSRQMSRASMGHQELHTLDLNDLYVNREATFILMNERLPEYFDNIEQFQCYGYIHGTNVKPIIYEEIIFIIKHYPAWERPYVPPEMENSFRELCQTARSFLKKREPIPGFLIAMLIKIRAAFLIYEDVYVDSGHFVETGSLMSDMSECSSDSNLSYEERASLDPSSVDKTLEEAQESHFKSEFDYLQDFETINSMFHASSLMIQGFIATLQKNRIDREKASGFSVDEIINKMPEELQSRMKPKKMKVPWVLRFCKNQVKGTRSVAAKLAAKSNINEQPAYKLIYFILTGFYDSHVINCLSKIGISLTSIMAIGDAQPILSKTFDSEENIPATDSRSVEITTGYAVIRSYDSGHSVSQDKKPVYISKYHEIKEGLIQCFWREAEHYCEGKTPDSRDIIWLMVPHLVCTSEAERTLGTVEYKLHARQIFLTVAERVQKIPALVRYHEIFMNSLQMYDLGQSPETVPISRMFYYNNSVNKVPPDCLSVSSILDGLLDEVCYRISDTAFTSDMSVNDRLRAQSNQLRTNKRMKKVYDKLLSKYKFTYMPVDPIIFLHQHLTLFAPFNDTEIQKNSFETYSSNFLELSTRYYRRLKHRLHNKSVAYLKRSLPAVLWRRYTDIEEDFDALAKESNVFQTWLSLCNVSQKECSDRLAINMCGLVECSQKDTGIGTCNLHDYLPKPVPVGKLCSLGMIRHDSTSTASSQFTAAWTNPYEYSFEMHDFQWQEKLPPDILLQELLNDNNTFRCVDHLYVPFLDQIIVRFHDDLDEFGLNVHTWDKSINSPIGLYDFFKHTVFDQATWVCQLEKAMSKGWPNETSNSLPTLASSGGIRRDDSKQSRNSNVNSIPSASYTIDDFKLAAFNLDNRLGTSGVSTMFHSTEGFKITVDKDTSFMNEPSISLKVEAEGHSFGLHANPDNPLLFQFEGYNGARIVFSKPESQGALYKDEIVVKKARIPIEKGIYEMKEITTVNFGTRSQLRRKRYMTEKLLRSLLVKLLTQESYVSIESLKTVESGQLIVIKSTTSMTDIRKPPGLTANDMVVMKDLKRIKESCAPHFRIISSALHKKKYIIMSPIKVLLRFSNMSITKKVFPNVNVKKKIEFTKCGGNDLPYTNANEPQTLKADYDIRVTLLSGLQVYSFPDVDDPAKHLIVQSYTANGPMNKEVSSEASRTFTRQGYIRIKYHDGTIKMIGVNGKTIIGTVPCLKPKWKKRSPKVFMENEEFQKELKLGKSIHKKVNRYQKRFIDRPGSPFWPKLNKRDRYFKTLMDNFRSSNADDFLRLTPRQILTPVNYKMQPDSFKDHYCLDVCTKDSFSTINDDGELITTYADGTKITSWFKIEQEMVIIVIKDDLSVGHLETDIDDYECNFLVPKTGGWISVIMYYQFEHPNYATVIYGMRMETSIYLPDDVQVKVKSDGTYFANFQNRFYSDISTEHIKLYTSFCRQCYDACKTIINVKHLYDNNTDVHPHEFLLETKDNFNKHFKVDYGGNCYKNNDFQMGNLKKDCLKHHTDDMEKFYAFDRNFNGKVFWSHQMFLNRIIGVQYNNKEHVKYYLDEKETMRAYEIISYANTHYCDRFVMPYRNADPPLLRPQSATKEVIGQIAFITRKLFEILPEWRDVVPLFDVICKDNVTKPWDLPLPDNVSIELVETEVDLRRSSENLIVKLPRDYTEKAMEYFKWLQRKAKRFKIGLLEDVVEFTKDIGHVMCTCADVEPNDKFKDAGPDMKTSINQSMLNNAMQQFDDGPKNRGRKQWSYADSVVRMPPVPVNSIISSLYGAESFGKKIASAFQMEESLMMSLSEFSNNPTSREKHVAIRSCYPEPCHFVKDMYGSVLRHQSLIEWRKPNATVSSSSSSKLSTPPKKKFRTNSLNKSTITTQAFDLFYLKEAPVNIEACSEECCCFSDNNRRNQAPQEGLLKVSSREAPVAMKKMNSFNKTYQKVSDLKCCRRNDKTLYTECKRMNKVLNHVADAPQKYKKSTSFLDSDSILPMILKNSSSM